MTVVDEMFAQQGSLDPDLIGINQASAAADNWVREHGETERDFIGRVMRDASAAGYRAVHIAGTLKVSNVVALRRSMPPGIV